MICCKLFPDRYITKTCPWKQYTENFFSIKNRKFHWNNSHNFIMFAQIIDCGYTLEPPQQGGSKEFVGTPCFEQK